MASETKPTTDHDEIRHWVEEHGGSPATVRGAGEDSTFSKLVSR